MNVGGLEPGAIARIVLDVQSHIGTGRGGLETRLEDGCQNKVIYSRSYTSHHTLALSVNYTVAFLPFSLTLIISIIRLFCALQGHKALKKDH